MPALLGWLILCHHWPTGLITPGSSSANTGTLVLMSFYRWHDYYRLSRRDYLSSVVSPRKDELLQKSRTPQALGFSFLITRFPIP